MAAWLFFGLAIINVVIGGVMLTVHEEPKPDWKTLVIWQGDDNKSFVFTWLDGAVTREQARNMKFLTGYSDARIVETFTVPGQPMDAEWVQSLKQ